MKKLTEIFTNKQEAIDFLTSNTIKKMVDDLYTNDFDDNEGLWFIINDQLQVKTMTEDEYDALLDSKEKEKWAQVGRAGGCTSFESYMNYINKQF